MNRVTGLMLSLTLSTCLSAQQIDTPLASKSYEMGESGQAGLLGVVFQIQPELSGGNIITFLASATYQEPYINNPQTRSVIPPTLISGVCTFIGEEHTKGPFRWTNSRDTRFVASLVRKCVQSDLGDGSKVLIPILETRLWCSDLVGELRHLSAVREQRVFEVVPAIRQPNKAKLDPETLKKVKDAHSAVSNAVTVIQIVYEGVKLIAGKLTIQGFVLKVLISVVSSVIQNVAEDAALKYVGQQGSGVLQQDGWWIFCRLCGTHFFQSSLSDGQLLTCSNTKCIGKARIAIPTKQ